MSLIGTEGLEGALREILETLQRQSVEISNFKSDLASRASRGDIHELERRLYARLSLLEGRVDRLEADTSVSLPLDVLLQQEALSSSASAASAAASSDMDSSSSSSSPSAASAAASGVLARIPVARYIAAHHSHLRQLHRSLDAAATRADVEALRAEAGEALRAALGSVADERAPRDTVQQLASALSGVQEELSAVQGSVATKVDRSDLTRLAAIASDLTSYAAFKASSGADIRELGLRTEEHRAALDRNLESVAKLSAVVQALAGACAAKAEARELAHVAGALERLGSEVSRTASLEDLRSLTTALSAVSGRAAGLEAGAKEAARGAAEERRALEARLGSSLSALRGELGSTAGALRAEVSGVREEVEARAYVTSLEATDEALAQAEARLDLCHRKTDVALRFIDWVRVKGCHAARQGRAVHFLSLLLSYTHTHTHAHTCTLPRQFADKGEAYEYNAASLERHMNSLAVDNRARTVDSMADMRSRVFGGVGGEALKASFAPAASANWLGGASTREGPLTGSGGVRLGGTSSSSSSSSRTAAPVGGGSSASPSAL